MTNLFLEDIKRLPPEEAIPLLNEYIERNPDDEEGFIIRGRKYWSLGKRKEALNDYYKANELNPQGQSKMLIDYSNSILDFYSKDLLNP